VIQMIKEESIRAGAVLNPSTPLDTLSYILEDLDMVLLMSVNPGFGGQKFIGSALEKISQLRKMVAEVTPDLDIEVDGGISLDNVQQAVQAGANVIVAGSAIFHTDNPRKTTQEMIRRAQNAWKESKWT